jgi:hypothetical protein
MRIFLLSHRPDIIIRRALCKRTNSLYVKRCAYILDDEKSQIPIKEPGKVCNDPFDLEPEPEAFVDAFAAEADMSPESFAEMVVGHYQVP